MEVGLLIATALGSVAAVAAAIVAIVQAARARSSQRDADDARSEAEAARDESVRLASVATAAFIRQADAQEKANALKEAEMTAPAWSGPRWVSGDIYRFVNTSGRTLKLITIDVEPEGAEKFVHLTAGNQNAIYTIGQSFDLMYSHKNPVSPRGIGINWRYEDEPDSEPNQFIIPV